MKKILVLLMLAFPYVVEAQQENCAIRYILDPYLYNSASSGFKSGLNVSLHYANQWIGLDGGPKEMALSIHRLFPETNFSAGGVMTCESSGVSKVMDVEISGTYRFLVSDWTWLSLNVGGGARSVGKDFSLLNYDGDPYFEEQEESELVPRFRMGCWLRFAEDTYVAFSVKGVGSDHLNNFGYKQATHYYLSGSKPFRLRPDCWFVWDGLLFAAKYSPIGAVLSGSCRWRRSWQSGLSYQIGRTVSPFVKFSYRDRLLLACVYSVSLDEMCVARSASSFSLMVGFRSVSDEKGKERSFRNAPL